MYLLGVSDHVMIAHSLPDPFFGPAQGLHGATYTVEVELRVTSLGAHQVVMDIGALRSELRAVLATFDYRNLDEHPAFADRLSTTECLAAHIAGQLASKLRALPASAAPPQGAVLRVLLRESPVAYAAYERELE
jgi:6-pyruvoyltetrahydropterin/6-carboxytetrahydropterin synthase